VPPNYQRRVVTKAVRIFDLGLLGFIFLVTLALSSGSFTWPSLSYVLVVRISVANLLLVAAYLGVSSLVFSGCGFYRSHRLSSRSRVLREVLLAASILTGVVFISSVPLELSFATAEFLLGFWLLTFVAFVLSRGLIWWVSHMARARGRNLRNVIVVGEGSEAVDLAARLSKDVGRGYRILQVIDTKGI
jgi:FlaA1/EpsC-like NDP-sugar epimerase